jgi:phosphoribosylaminoimidazole (AIR) synthetase
MRKVFNLGIGLIAVVPPEKAEMTIQIAISKNEVAKVVGEIE